MRRQYLLNVAVASADLTRPRIRADWGSARVVNAGPYQILVYTPDGWPQSGLSLEQSGDSVRLLEGTMLPGGGTSQPIRPGQYNEITIDGAAGTLTIRNDAYGALPLYFRAQRDSLIIANSLWFITDFTGADVDEQGLAQQLISGTTLGARTLFRDIWQLMPGRGYHFDLRARGRLSMWRQSRMWTGIIDEGAEDAAGHFRDLWEQALDRAPGRTREPVAVALDDGLGARLVAAGMNARGTSTIALLHAAADSPEAQVARRAAEAARAQLLTNTLDDSFDFDRLSLSHLSRFVEALHDPIWDSSAVLLASRGFRRFSTGAALGLFFGAAGERQGLTGGLRLGRRAAAQPVGETDINQLVEIIARPYEQRARIYAPLLVEPYRSLMLDHITPLRQAIADRLLNYAADGQVTRRQLQERYAFEHQFRQVDLTRERVLMYYGALVAPTLDPDLGTYLSNLTPALRADSRLLLRVIRKLYPRMARVPAPADATGSLPLGLNLRRFGFGGHAERTPDFESWLLLGDRLRQYERLFVGSGHFFNVQAINAYFSAVQQGRMTVGDGNDTLALLQLAWLIRPHLNRSAAATRITATINGRLRTTSMALAAD